MRTLGIVVACVIVVAWVFWKTQFFLEMTQSPELPETPAQAYEASNQESSQPTNSRPSLEPMAPTNSQHEPEPLTTEILESIEEQILNENPSAAFREFQALVNQSGFQTPYRYLALSFLEFEDTQDQARNWIESLYQDNPNLEIGLIYAESLRQQGDQVAWQETLEDLQAQHPEAPELDEAFSIESFYRADFKGTLTQLQQWRAKSSGALPELFYDLQWRSYLFLEDKEAAIEALIEWKEAYPNSETRRQRLAEQGL